MSHTSGNILLHLIFSTHQRRSLIKTEFRDGLFAYLGGIVREMNGTALIINGIADHVHMLVRIRPAQSAAEIARVVKQTHRVGFVSAVQNSHGKRATEFSASANRMFPRSQNTSPARKNITGSIHFRMSLLHS